MKFKFTLNGTGGELDTTTVEVDHEISITTKLTEWLQHEHHILADGDTITIEATD